MSTAAKSMAWLFGGIAVIAGYLSLLPLAVLAAVLMIGTIAISYARQSQRKHQAFFGYSLSPSSRTLLVPIKRLYKEIETMMLDIEEYPTLKGMSSEVAEESKRMFEETCRVLEVRDDLRKLLSSETADQIEKRVKRIEAQVETAKNTLEQLHFRLGLARANDAAEDGAGEDLRDSIQNLRSMVTTLEETEQLRQSQG